MRLSYKLNSFFSYLIRYPKHLYVDFLRFLSILQNKVPLIYSDHIFSNSADLTRKNITEIYQNNALYLLPLLMKFDDMREKNISTSLSLKSDTFDLFLMVDIIKKLKIKTLIEYGSGASSIVFAKLLNDNHLTDFISMESEKKWKESTENCIYKLLPKLKDIFNITISNLEETKSFGFPKGCNYKKSPKKKFDLIYIDGPSLVGGFYEYTITPIIYNQVNTNSLIVIDGRNKNCKVLKKVLKKLDKNWNQYKAIFPSDDTVFINNSGKFAKELISNYRNFFVKIN